MDHPTGLVGSWAAIVVPPSSAAVPNGTAKTASTQRNDRLRGIAEPGRGAWQSVRGDTKRVRAEAAAGRLEQVIGDAPRLRTNGCQATGVEAAVHGLGRIPELGCPGSVRSA